MPACRIVFRGEGVPDRIVEARRLEVSTQRSATGSFVSTRTRKAVNSAAFPEEEGYGNPQQDPESSRS